MDIAADAGHVYFTDWSGGRVVRIAKGARSAPTPIATGQLFSLRSPIVVDATHAYWVAEAEMMRSAILRVPKNVAAPTTPEVVVADQPSIAGLAADEDHLYFTSFFGGAVRRGAKRGGPVSDVATGIRGPVGIAVHGESVFWASKDDGVVSMLPKTASATEGATIVARDLVSPYALAVDASHVYWSTAVKATGLIARVPRDGSAPATTLAAEQDNATSLAISDTHVYWSTTTTVCRIAKLGGAIEVIASGAPGSRSLPQLSEFAPKGLVVDGASVFCVNLAGNGAIMRFDGAPSR